MVLKTVSTLGATGGGGGGGTPGGANSTIQFNNAGAFAGSANLTWDGANVQVGSSGLLKFSNGVTTSVGFKAPAIIPANVAWTLPSTDGTAGQFIITNGSGTLSWASANLTPTAPTNYSLPIVSGTTTVGQTLSSTTGGWNGYPSPTYAYQWVRGASNIGGATSATYPLVDADYNNTIKVIVTATNSAGSANATSAATATIAGTVPNAPTIGTATAGNAQAAVAFTAPSVTGGPSITSYTATSSPDGITGSAASSPITVSGLTNGRAYTFTVTATNSIGTGNASAASNSVTPSAAPATDTYFPYVPLLLETTSTNGQQNNTFLDSSTNAFTITRNGTPTQGSITPYWPNGQWSNYFSVATNYINIAASASLASNTSSFTLEFWYNSTATGNGRPAGSGGSGFVANTWMCASNNTAGKLEFFVFNYSAALPMFSSTSSTVASDGAWHHIVLVRSTNTWAMFIDGTRQGSSITSSASFNGTSSGLYIGYSGLTGETANAFSGYISNFRFVNGSAQYDPTQTTITVPTSPLTPVTNTAILTCQSNRFLDTNTQVAAKTITVNGTPTVQAFQPFSPAASYSAATYAGSGYFGGSDYLNAGTNSAFIIGTGDFTIELWVYLISYGNTYTGFFTTRVGGQGMDIQILNSGATLMLGNSTGAIISANSVVPFNAWTHICAVRSGSSNSLYVNGTRVATGTDSTNFTDNGAKVATSGPSGVATPVAYISNVRFVKGTAVYSPASTTITVPTTPVTAITNTSLLLNMANAGIYDAAVQNVMTTVGDAQASTTQSKWSPTSMKYDGTGDWLTAVDGPQLQLGTGDFTIEGWVYLSAVGVVYGILSKGTATTGWSVNVTVLNKLQFSYTTSNLTGTTTLATGTWYYFAVVRSGIATGNLKLYLNGSVEATSGGAVTDNFNQTNTLYVGADRIGGSALNGYLQDIRITKGVGRTITTPTAAFPVQ
jgi:hypothetical protein